MLVNVNDGFVPAYAGMTSRFPPAQEWQAGMTKYLKKRSWSNPLQALTSCVFPEPVVFELKAPLPQTAGALPQPFGSVWAKSKLEKRVSKSILKLSSFNDLF